MDGGLPADIFSVASVVLDTCACTKRWDLSKLLNSHLSFHLYMLVSITLMFDAANLHAENHEILGAKPRTTLFLMNE